MSCWWCYEALSPPLLSFHSSSLLSLPLLNIVLSSPNTNPVLLPILLYFVFQISIKTMTYVMKKTINVPILNLILILVLVLIVGGHVSWEIVRIHRLG